MREKRFKQKNISSSIMANLSLEMILYKGGSVSFRLRYRYFVRSYFDTNRIKKRTLKKTKTFKLLSLNGDSLRFNDFCKFDKFAELKKIDKKK